MAEILTVTVTGADTALQGLALTDPRVRQGAEAGLVQIGEVIMGEAKELAPVDLGTLRDSGYVLSPSVFSVSGPSAQPSAEAHALVEQADGVTVAVGFGGPSAPYALVQHEKFPVKRVPGKTWKYLETPAKAQARNVAPQVAKAVRARLETGRGAAG